MICDGGYLQYPCLISGQSGNGTPTREYMAKTLGSPRKDIETIFGRLKKRFAILANGPRVQKKDEVDHIFITCCILHNQILKHDGYLDTEFPFSADGAIYCTSGSLACADVNVQYLMRSIKSSCSMAE